MYGWRARIGHLAPSRGDLFVYEFYRLAPEGVLLLNTTGTIRNLVRDDIERQIAGVEAGARDLAETGVDLIVVGGSPLFTTQGYGSEARLGQRLTEACGVPCVAGIQLEVEALRAAGVRRPVIASPYPPELDERLVEYLGQAGFEVQGAHGLGVRNNAAIGALPEHASYQIARRAAAAAPDADGVFLPCLRWPTLKAVPLLEQELGIPVISSCLAIAWGAFRRLGIRDRFEGFGSLMAGLQPEGAAGRRIS